MLGAGAYTRRTRVPGKGTAAGAEETEGTSGPQRGMITGQRDAGVAIINLRMPGQVLLRSLSSEWGRAEGLACNKQQVCT